jgi:HTH-type transcriptional regulator/antitoxin HigA
MSKFNVNDLLESTFNDSKEQIDIRKRLEEKLTEYDLSKTKALNILGIDKDSFEDIISGSAKQPSMINVLKIAQFIEMDLKDVVSALMSNQSSETIGSIQKVKKVSFIAKNFDIKKLTKLGFFDDKDNIDYLVHRVLTFFGYAGIHEFEEELMGPLYSKSKRTFSDKMKDFWVKSAYQCFKSINNPNEYDREALKDLIVKAKPYCQDVVNGLLTVCKALYNNGVTVIIQNQLTTTQVRGGTFVVNGKPCIVITDLFKRYPTIWTTLVHELHHVLYDLERISSTQYHLSGETDLFLIEDKADDFAIEYFCGVKHFHYIKPHINNSLVVGKFARDLQVHPSFIYSAFRYFQEKLFKKSFYGAYSEFFPDYTVAIKQLNLITWKENSLPEVASKIKSIFEINTT